MALKVSLFFSEAGEGWSEVYYTSQENIIDFTGPPPDDFIPPSPVSTLLTLRRALCTKAVTLLRVRVSKLDNPGEFLVFDLPPWDNKGTYEPTSETTKGTTEIFASLLVTLEAGTVARRKLFLGGIPEENVASPQTYDPVSKFINVLRKFLVMVSGVPYCIRSRPIKPANAFASIKFFDVHINGRVAYISPNVMNPAGPDIQYVLIRGMSGPKGWNGVHKARPYPTDANKMILGPSKRVMLSSPPWAEAQDGTVQLMLPRTVALTTYEIGRIVSRKRGRAFGSPRGRR